MKLTVIYTKMRKTSMNKKFTPLLGDNPIQNLEEDLLDRKRIAEHFVQIVLNLDRSRGVVTSVFGPWGSGKTSFINLVTEELKQQRYNVLEFNPWMFHGTKQLLMNFFDEISAQMISKEKGIGLAHIGDLFRNYGASLFIRHKTSRVLTYLRSQPQPNAGTVRHLAHRMLTRLRSQPQPQFFLANTRSFLQKKFLKDTSLTSQKLRARIEAALNECNDHPITVVIDDIDRLPASEIRDVFQLVRLTASFPNLIYIVVCDRNQVEKALKKQGLSGRQYLEKIVQFPFDLPRLSRIQIDEQTSIALEQVLSTSASPSLYDMPVWLDIYHEIILPLIRNMRDVRRYAIAIQQALINFDQEIEQVDILALEAIRLFLPDVFKLLPEAIDTLTISSIDQQNRRRIESIVQEEVSEKANTQTSPDKQIEELISAGKPRERIVQCMLHRLFPATHRRASALGEMGPYPANPGWEMEQLQRHRVSHENILRLYLEQTVDADLLAFSDAKNALQVMNDKAAFENFWQQHNSQDWWSIIRYLERFEDEFLLEHIDSGVTVLLNLLPKMPIQSQCPYHVNQLAVMRVILRLFRKLDNADTIAASVQKILREVATLSSKMALIELVGHKNDIGSKIVSEIAAKKLEGLLCRQIQFASSDSIAKERDPARLVWFVKFECDIDGKSYTIENSPKLTYVLLRSSQTQVSKSYLDSRHVHFSEPTINWEFLSRLYGDVTTLMACVEKLDKELGKLKPWFEDQNIPISEVKQTLKLAREYMQKQS